jgi:predicted TIM-barrel fold metal-dependent hydrolase
MKESRTMGRAAIISVDGHVTAARSAYRQYIEQQYLDVFDEWLREQEARGAGEPGGVQPGLDVASQWDSDLRLKDMETQGVVAEVLFPNGMPFQVAPADNVNAFSGPELDRQARLAYNRWLADFCAQTPGRRAGQALIAFDDVDLAVEDIHWARDHGLGGIMMPTLLPGGIFFFDPALDPVWAACVEVDLPISQHGGSGAPVYNPSGFAAIMTLALEHSFYSGRSLWQMILGGVFERFPRLRVAFVETEADWIAPAVRKLDRRLQWGDDWTGWAKTLQRQRSFTRLARDYWADNCFAGISPFTIEQVPLEELARPSADYEHFAIGCDNAMFGVDYPHFESIFPETASQVADLVGDPSISAEVSRKILYENAARVYGFDLEALRSDIERIGFEVDLAATT